MRPRERSYGDSSIFTRSPGAMRILKRRIFPEREPSASCPLSSERRKTPLRSASVTSPSNSTLSPAAAMRPPLRDCANVGRLGALLTLSCVELHLGALSEALEALAGDAGVVDEQVLRAVLRRDEPEALVVAEPLDGSGCHVLTSFAALTNKQRKTTGVVSGTHPVSCGDSSGNRGSARPQGSLHSRLWTQSSRSTSTTSSLPRASALPFGRSRRQPSARRAAKGSRRSNTSSSSSSRERRTAASS